MTKAEAAYERALLCIEETRRSVASTRRWQQRTDYAFAVARDWMLTPAEHVAQLEVLIDLGVVK